MATATLLDTPPKTLQDPTLKERLQQLRQANNYTNLFYIGRTYLFLAATIGGAVALVENYGAWGVPGWLCFPAVALAVVLIGAFQHQLTVLAHEASHHVLLKTRLLNEMVSDWFLMFPVFSTTHHYRLQHLAHHQFVNDPDRDPNASQLQVNGHWREFPMDRPRFWKELAAQMRPSHLIRYLLTQAKHNAVSADKSPYRKADTRESRVARLAGVLYFFAMILLLPVVSLTCSLPVLLATVGVAWAAIMLFLGLIPETWFLQSRIQPTYTMKAMSLLRVTHLTLVVGGVAVATNLYGLKAFGYFAILWILPLATSFSFFMMMRQLVQHSNADRGWLTNTRIFLVPAWLRDSVLPFGQDYHLPHHMYATVPHYNLRPLHDLLMEYPEYRDDVVIVHGAVLSRHEHHHGEGRLYPSVVDVLGPDYSKLDATIHVDDTVLDGERVEDKATILAVGRRLRGGE